MLTPCPAAVAAAVVVAAAAAAAADSDPLTERPVDMESSSSPLFVHPVDPNLLCGVCGGVLHLAVLTPCGHAFCSLCLHTWINQPPPSPPSSPSPSTAPTCPECRSPVTPDLVKPVHALRNLVRGLEVCCRHREEGCRVRLTLDTLPAHLDTCPFHPVPCAGCAHPVRRLDLPDHHMTCAAIAASIHDDDDDDDNGDDNDTPGDEEGGGFRQEFRVRVRESKPPTTRDVSVLLSRIQALESRVERLLQELQCARHKTLALERQLEQLGGQLAHKPQRPQHDTRHFLQGVCDARTPETIGKLSLLIARHLLEKPREVEVEEVFRAIGRCYDAFHWAGPGSQHDVHMLLATAYASNWFSAAQRSSLHCWLKTLTATRPATRLFNT